MLLILLIVVLVPMLGAAEAITDIGDGWRR
jgi:hypothetical protein